MSDTEWLIVFTCFTVSLGVFLLGLLCGVRGYFQTRRNPDQRVEFETDCPVAISHLTPYEALRLADELTKAANKALGLKP